MVFFFQGNVNILNQPNTSQTQTVMLGNQLVKVQSMNQLQQQQPKISTQQIQIVGKNNANSGGNQATNDTVVLTTTPGQTIKMQSNTQAGGSGTVNRTGPQQIILSSSLKVCRLNSIYFSKYTRVNSIVQKCAEKTQ
jgi:hypothetical protein